MSDTEHTPTDEIEDEDANLLVVDPEDYNQSQRLKEIHRARQDVRKTLQEHTNYGTESERKKANYRLNDAVSLYILELQPPAERAIEKGTIDREQIELPDSVPWDDMFEYAAYTGIDPNENEPVSKTATMSMYLRANQVAREIGIGLDLDTDKDDEWEV